MLSLGTGLCSSPQNAVEPPLEITTSTNTLKVLFNWSRARLSEAISAKDVDEQVRASLPEPERSVYLRHDPEFSGDLPRLDDVRSIPRLREKADEYMSHAHVAQVKKIMIASSFFFELRHLPTYDRKDGTYLCEGTIRIRGDPNLVLELISNLEPKSAQFRFVRNGDVLQDDRFSNGICGRCRLYKHHVRFHVQELSHIQTVCLKFDSKMQHRISGFPQKMTWFCEQQGLYDVFSTRRTAFDSCACNYKLEDQNDELDGWDRRLHKRRVETLCSVSPKRKREIDERLSGLTGRHEHRQKRRRIPEGEQAQGYF